MNPLLTAVLLAFGPGVLGWTTFQRLALLRALRREDRQKP